MTDNPFEQFRQPADDNPFSEFAPKPVRPTATPEPAKPKLKRTWGEAASDTALGVVQGGVNLVGGTAALVERVGFLNPLRDAGAHFGLLDEGGSTYAADATTAANEYLGEKLSPVLKRKKQELAETEGFIGSAKKVLTDPVLAGQFVAEQVPNVATLGYGTVATGARAAAAARPAALATRQATLTRGATMDAANAAGKEVIETARKKAGTRFLTGAGTTVESGNSYVQARDQALNAPEETWTANPAYTRLVDGGMDPDEAKQVIANEVGLKAAAVTAPLAAAGARVSAPFETSIFNRAVNPAGVRGLFTPAGAAKVAQGAAAEAAEETVQEGGAQFGTNVGMQTLDPNQALLEGVPEAAGTGAALGLLLGGGMGAGGVALSRGEQPTLRRGQPPQTPTPDQPAPPAQDAAGGVPEAVQAQAEPQAVEQPEAVAQAEQPPTEDLFEAQLPPEGNSDIPDNQGAAIPPPAAVPFPDAPAGSLQAAFNVMDPSAPAQVAAVAAEAEAQKQAGKKKPDAKPKAQADNPAMGAPPPWVNAETGEFTPPSDDMLANEIRTRIELMSKAGKGMLPITKETAQAWGVELPRLRAIRARVLEQRKSMDDAIAAGRRDRAAAEQSGQAAAETAPATTMEGTPDDAAARGDSGQGLDVAPVGDSGEPLAGPADVPEAVGGVGAEPAAAAEGAAGEVAAPAPEPAAATPRAAQVMAAFEASPAAALEQLTDDEVMAVAKATGKRFAKTAKAANVRAKLAGGDPAKLRAAVQQVLAADAQPAAASETPAPRLVSDSGGEIQSQSRKITQAHGRLVATRIIAAQRDGEEITIEEAIRRANDMRAKNRAEAERSNSPEAKAEEDQRLRKKAEAESVERKDHFDTSTGGKLEDGDYETETGLRYRVSTSTARNGATRQLVVEVQSDGTTKPVGLVEEGSPDAGAVAWASGLRDGYLRPAATAASDTDRRANEAERARIDALPKDARDAEIAALRARVQELEQGARTNQLTGLPNKAAFEADEALGWPAVVAIDMDGLKRLNDTVGHENADAVLRALGRELDALASDSIRFYHRSGDEFAARFKNKADAETVMAELQSDLEGLKAMLVVEVAGQPAQEYEYRGIGISYGLGATYEAADLAANEQKRERLAAGIREDARADGPPRRLREVPRDPEGREGDADGQPAAAQEVAPAASIEAAAAEAATSPTNALAEPTDGQKEAGNYKKGKLRLHGLELSIENPAGTRRRPEWPPLAHHYGYIRRTEGADGDHIDVFLGDNAGDASLPVFVVNQVNRDGKFDEHKVVMGFADEAAARKAYLDNYSKGWSGLGSIRGMSLDEFKAWLQEGDTTKPAPAKVVTFADFNGALNTAKGALQRGLDAMKGPTFRDKAKKFLAPLGEKPQGRRADVTKQVLDTLDSGNPSALREFGVEVPASITAALEAKFEGRLVEKAPVAPLPSDRFSIGQPVHFKSGIYGGSEGTVEAIKPSGRIVVLAKNGNTRFGVNPDEVNTLEPGPASAAAEPPPPAPAKRARQANGADAKKAKALFEKKEPANTEDSGAELWYNRRNRTGAGLQWSDLEDLNATLKAKEAVKSKVWPRPDYEALVNDGMHPVLARLLKQVYDGLAAKPKVYGAATDEQLREYVETIGNIRDKVFAALQKVDAKAMGPMLVEGKGPDLVEMINQTGLPNLEAAIFPGDPRNRYGSGNPDNNRRALLIGGNKVIKNLRITIYDLRSAAKDVDAGWPTPREAWERMFVIRESKAGSKVYRGGKEEVLAEAEFYVVKKGQRRIVADGLPTREAAIEKARELATQNRKKGETLAEEAIDLEEAVRTGAARRGADEDITSDRLRETFGFKGVNFGNWMKGESPAKRRERQLHLNHTYDAFQDLAELLNMPPKALSLNGMLGLAIGAQGNGRGSGAAHFVPGVNEINLTRAAGVGSLAHEWGHAMDHYFAVQAGDRFAKQEMPFITHAIADGIASGTELRPEVLEAFKALHTAMTKRALTAEEMAKRLEQRQADALRRLNSWINPLRGELERRAKPADKDRVLAEFDALAERIRAGDLGDGYVPARNARGGLRPVLADLRNLVKDATGRVPSKSDFEGLAINAEARAYAVANKSDAAEHVPQMAASNYAIEAMKLDKDKRAFGGGNYWKLPTEMLARAFQSYALDRLAERNARNDYLTRPQMDEATFKVAQEMGLAEDGDRYPRGDERKAINEAFDTLTQTLRTREDDAGNVALFSQPDTSAQTNTPEFKRWFGDSKVVGADGQPLVVYHGTAASFDTFSDEKGPFYFSDEAWLASEFADAKQLRGSGANIVPAFLSLKKPLLVDFYEKLLVLPSGREEPFLGAPSDWSKNNPALIARARKEGADGIIMYGVIDSAFEGNAREPSTAYVAFEPVQIKSATGNRGTFDPKSGNILLSKSDAAAEATPDQARVRAYIAPVTSTWGATQPRVEVVATGEGLPARAKTDPGYKTADGYYDDSTGTVYLVANRIPTQRDALRVLAHESTGHYGVEAITGPALWEQIGNTVARMRENKKHAALFAEVDRRYKGANAAIALRETLAVMAEKGVRNSVMDRALAAIRKFVRDVLGINLRFSDAELRQHLVAAARYVRDGRRPREAAQPDAQAEPVFSKGTRSAFTDAMTFAGTVRAFLDGKLPKDRAIQVTEGTPDVLVKLGAPDVPIVMAPGTLTKFKFAGGDLHPEITQGMMTTLVKHLHEPVAVFDSSTEPGALVVMTEVDADGKRVMASLHVRASSERMVVNRVTSLYGRERREDFVRWAQQGKLRYLDRTRVPAWLTTAGLQSPGVGPATTGTGRRVLLETDVIKPFSSGAGLYSQRGAMADTEALRDIRAKAAAALGMDPDAARTKLAGVALRNANRAEGRMQRDPTPEPDPFTPEAMALLEQWEAMRYPSSKYLFHTTPAANLESIRREGLRPGKPARQAGVSSPSVVSLAANEATAAYYGADGDVMLRVRKDYDPGPLGDDLLAGDGAYTSEQGIPPEALEVKQGRKWVPLVPGANQSTGLFSQPPDQVLADLEAVMAAGRDDSVLERARARLANLTPKKVKDALRGTWLGALGTNHLTELGSDYFEGMRHYTDFLKAMEADRNTLMAEGEELAEKARKWASKNKPMARRLFDLMHSSTIDGVDPSTKYQVLQFRFGGKLHDVTRKNVADAIKEIRQQMRERSGDPKQNMLDRIKTLQSMLNAEQRRTKQYGGLVARWNELDADAQQLYKDFRDTYAARSDAVEAALVQRIEDLKGDGVTDGQRRALVAKIREQFETNRLQGVYFPLQRFGKFFVAAEKGDTNTFLMYESINEAERAEKDLKARGWKVTSRGKRIDQKAENAPSGTFVAEVITELRKANISDKTQDSIYQLYLNALPELSMRKHQIHRKAVPGFDPDAVRAFGWHMQHGSHQLAKLRYMHKLEGVLKLLETQQKEARKAPDADVRRIAAGDAVLEELNKRHDWIANPMDSGLTNLVSSFGFTYYLGITPAAALVNLSQTAIVTFPVLAARYGPVKAMNTLLAAGRDSMRTVGNIDKTLTDPEEVKAYQALKASGAIDKTQAHNLAGIADGGLQGYSPAWAKTMEVIGWAFHKAEVVNREASAMAAFRLARQEGMEFDAAVKHAHDVVIESHFDYSNANRARFMQSGTAKVLLMFRQYSLNITWFLARNTWQATKGLDPETRKMARRKMAGVLGMTALFSGTLGLPLMSATFGVLNAVASTFGDDDEPFSAETEFKNFLADMLGPDAARIVASGVANEVTGADIASRVSLSQLWFRDADRELEGRGMYYHLLEQAAGPMGGVLKNVLVGKQQIDEGNVWRGVETMLPKALKDTMKGARYSIEGVNNFRGDPLVEDVSLWQALLQLNGFTPAQVARQYDANSAVKGYEQHILNRRQHLTDAYAMAWRLGDADTQAAVLEKMRAFNATNPELAISAETLRRSLKSRLRYSQRAEDGIIVNPKLEARVRGAVRFNEGG